MPTAVSGRADSLNVGVKSFPGAPFAGTDLDEDQIFVDSTYLDGDLRLDRIPPARRDRYQVDN